MQRVICHICHLIRDYKCKRKSNTNNYKTFTDQNSYTETLRQKAYSEYKLCRYTPNSIEQSNNCLVQHQGLTRYLTAACKCTRCAYVMRKEVSLRIQSFPGWLTIGSDRALSLAIAHTGACSCILIRSAYGRRRGNTLGKG